MFYTNVKNSSIPVVDEAATNQEENINTTTEEKSISKPTVINTELNLENILETERKEILERNQILSLQQKRFKPIRTGTFLLMRLVMILFPINFILLITWATRKNTNLNRKSFARATLAFYFITILLLSILIISLVVLGYPVNPIHWLNEFSR